MVTRAGVSTQEVPKHEVDEACATARRHGYDCSNFRYTLFRPAHRLDNAPLTGEFVVVSMVWPTIRSEMYRASNGQWVRDFERDLLSYHFQRRAKPHLV